MAGRTPAVILARELMFRPCEFSQTFKLDKKEGVENKIAEIKLAIPGKDLFAKKQCKSFEEATDLAVEALRKQIKKHKGKLTA